jgi:hypothetical protein
VLRISAGKAFAMSESSPQKAAATVKRARTINRKTLVRRIWRTADAQVRDIEDRLAATRPEPVERERDARMLAVLVKTLRELAALDEAASGPSKRAEPEDDDPVPRDIDEFRRELARRIDALVASRTGSRLPGEPQ